MSGDINEHVSVPFYAISTATLWWQFPRKISIAGRLRQKMEVDPLTPMRARASVSYDGTSSPYLCSSSALSVL